MICPLCGFEFDERTPGCQTHCPMGEGCQMVCCPHCGYQGIDANRSAIVGWVQRLWRRVRGETPASTPVVAETDGDAIPLSRFPKGRWAEVAFLSPAHASRLQRLSALGIAPGSQVRLQQQHPAYVVQVGSLELALDAEIAGEIFVTPVGGNEGAVRD